MRITWDLFMETGNIETYLLLKNQENQIEEDETQNITEDDSHSSGTFKM